MEPNSLTQERVREVFEYDDGKLIRKTTGKIVGCLTANGYLVAVIDGKLFGIHRLVFLYHKGYLPPLVDHEDEDKKNNRISNLLDRDRSLNGLNSSKVRSSTGYRGVTYNKRRKKFVAKIRKDYKHIHLGYFATAEEASTAYQSARNNYLK